MRQPWQIIIQGNFEGTRNKGRFKLRWTDDLREITSHPLNTKDTLPDCRRQMPIKRSHQTGHKGEPWSIWQRRRRRTVRDSFLEGSSDAGLSWKTLDPLWPLDTLGSVKHQANIIRFSSTAEQNHQWLYMVVPVSHAWLTSQLLSNSISPSLTWECSFPESSKSAVGTGESSYDKMSLTLTSLELVCSHITLE